MKTKMTPKPLAKILSGPKPRRIHQNFHFFYRLTCMKIPRRVTRNSFKFGTFPGETDLRPLPGPSCSSSKPAVCPAEPATRVTGGRRVPARHCPRFCGLECFQNLFRAGVGGWGQKHFFPLLTLPCASLPDASDGVQNLRWLLSLGQ